jgi:hypothetical protein
MFIPLSILTHYMETTSIQRLSKRLAMLLKKIDVLRCISIVIFVAISTIISQPANAKLAVPDGKYFGYEESITVKSGKVVSCDGVAFFDNGNNMGCKGWKFTSSIRSVVKATSTSGNVSYFCRQLPKRDTRFMYECEANGWRKGVRFMS